MRKRGKDLVKRADSMSNLLDFGRLHDIVDGFERSFFDKLDDFGWHIKTFEQIQPRGSFPKVNVIDSEREYDVEIAIAGFDKGDLALELKDNCLFIKAEKKEEASDEGKSYLMKEIAQRSFRRVIRFPVEVDPNNIDCICEGGLCKCTIGKVMTEEKDDTVKIDIQ